jgi:uncharacterized protein
MVEQGLPGVTLHPRLSAVNSFMKIGIISDSHDHIKNLRKAIEDLKNAGVGLVIHCGDFCAPFVLDELDTLGVGVHGVFGNVDGDKFSMQKKAPALNNIVLHGELLEIDVEGVKIAANHYPAIADGLARSGKYDLVCYGHTHKRDLQTIGTSLLLNPGDIMGRFGNPSYAIFDTETREVELKNLN